MLRIDFVPRKAFFRPGEKVEVQVHWSEPSPPELISLEVSWFTVGKGTGDSRSIAETEIVAEGASGHDRWSFILPRGPLSCDGKLLAIQWRILAECQSSGQEVEVPFVLGWEEGPIDLKKFPVDDDKAKILPLSLG